MVRGGSWDLVSQAIPGLGFRVPILIGAITGNEK